jgi:hypothetical protein
MAKSSTTLGPPPVGAGRAGAEEARVGVAVDADLVVALGVLCSFTAVCAMAWRLAAVMWLPPVDWSVRDGAAGAVGRPVRRRPESRWR